MLTYFLTSMVALTFAQYEGNPTIFVWKPDPNKPFQGDCYEIDKETRGQKFAVKAITNKCKPANTVYYWQAIPEKFTGKCYEVDSETQGQQYAKFASKENCYPKNTTTIWHQDDNGRAHCFLVDAETGGKEFVLKVMKDQCREEKLTYVFKPRESGKGGRCFEIGENTGYQKSTEAIKCRPSDYQLKWIAKNELEGECWEVDPAGPHLYSRRAQDNACLADGKPEYVWKTSADGISGTCYKKLSTKDGQSVYQDAASNNCEPENVIKKFVRVSELAGRCMLVDKETQGARFSRTTSLSDCRPKETIFKEVQVGSIFRCYELDEETGGNNYIGISDKNNCKKKEGKPKWLVDPTDPWKGKCWQIETLSGQVRQRSIRDKFCRPKKTRFVWHNSQPYIGSCYEIPDDGDNREFAMPVEAKKCTHPKMKFKIHMDVDPKTNLGKCYKVDAETGGDKYSVPVGTKKCKNEYLFRQDPNDVIEKPWQD